MACEREACSLCVSQRLQTIVFFLSILGFKLWHLVEGDHDRVPHVNSKMSPLACVPKVSFHWHDANGPQSHGLFLMLSQTTLKSYSMVVWLAHSHSPIVSRLKIGAHACRKTDS